MTHSVPFADENRQILEEASVWFVEFRLGEPDSVTRRRFANWLRRSPEHIRAYMEVTGTYARLPDPHSAQRSDLDRIVASLRKRRSIVPMVNTAFPRSAQANESRAGTNSRISFARTTALLAGIAACVLVGLGMVLFMLGSPVYETQIGERRSIALEDGSRIDLNARTKIRVLFERSRRRVDLVQGQAFFHVAKDSRRPFVVESGSAFVRAVGTQFDVYRGDTATTVTVVEGRVALRSTPAMGFDIQSRGPAAIQPNPTGSGSAIELAAGEQAVISAASIAKSPRANVAAATAWTQGQLEFDETPLPQAVAEFNRYSRKPLVIRSAELAAVRISGVYSSSDIASFVLFLRNQPDLTVTETDRDIRLTNK